MRAFLCKKTNFLQLVHKTGKTRNTTRRITVMNDPLAGGLIQHGCSGNQSGGRHFLVLFLQRDTNGFHNILDACFHRAVTGGINKALLVPFDGRLMVSQGIPPKNSLLSIMPASPAASLRYLTGTRSSGKIVRARRHVKNLSVSQLIKPLCPMPRLYLKRIEISEQAQLVHQSLEQIQTVKADCLILAHDHDIFKKSIHARP